MREAFESGDWAQFLIPAAEALGDWPAVELDADMVEKVRHGHRIPAAEDATGWARAISEQGDLVALIEVVEEDREWQPRKVFFTT
jgi:tRNA pseudouridine55 synthase